MTLHAQLRADPTSLRWRCAHETATGLDVLRIARPGLVLEPDGVAVPRAVFHRWMFVNAERLLEAHVGFGQLESHEADWLQQGLALVGEPLDVDEPTRMLVLMSLASLNTFSAIRQGAREMGDVYGWASRALTWSSKRVLGERKCPHDPVSLNAELIELHVQLASFKQQDVTDAARAERQAQVAALVSTWRDEVGAPDPNA